MFQNIFFYIDGEIAKIILHCVRMFSSMYNGNVLLRPIDQHMVLENAAEVGEETAPYVSGQ